jgi:N-acetylglucosamine kinase-like BadF-type ATPase
VSVVLGVDAGGTGSRAVAVSDGRVVGRYSCGPMNLLLHPDAVQRLAGLIRDSGAAAAGVGLPGLRQDGAARQVTDELSALTGARVIVADDTEIAQLAAFGGRPGIAVVAGTGSVAFGRTEDGRTARIGGHGFLLGDEGSGYWIGVQLVRAALRSRDGTGPHTALEALMPHVFAADLDEVVALVHADPRDRALLARLVPLVADLEDPVTHGIFSAAADELVALSVAVQRVLGDGLPVAAVGGVFSADVVRRQFTVATKAVPALRPPEFGAVHLADPAWSRSGSPA